MTDFSIAKLLNAAAAVQPAPLAGPVLSPPVSPAMLQQYWRHMMAQGMPAHLALQLPPPPHNATAQYIWTQLWLQQQHRPAMPTCPPDLLFAYIQAMAASKAAQPTQPAAKAGLTDTASTKPATRQPKKGERKRTRSHSVNVCSTCKQRATAR
jgi:hypothetical protein